MAAFAPLIGGLASWGLGKLGIGGSGAKVGASSPTFKRAEQLGDLSKEFAFDYAMPEGKKLLGEAESTLQMPTDYWSKLLSGNRAEMMSAEAPEIQNISDLYGQQKKNISMFTPQGGGQTAALTEAPFQQARDVGTLLEKARPQAAQALENISKDQAAMSGMVTGEGLQAGSLSLNAISDQINALLGKSAQDIPLQQQTGAGLYNILKGMMGGGGPPPPMDSSGGGYVPGEAIGGG
jgi:hypothetical protein